MKRLLLCAIALLLLAGCQSSHVLVGAQRPPIDPSQVQVYLQPPNQYEQVALLEASSAVSGAFTRQQKTDKVITRMKREAAALGANGILLQGMGNEYAGSVGSANASFYGNSAWATGFSAPVYNKAGTAIAIYVPGNQEAATPAVERPVEPTMAVAPSQALVPAAPPSVGSSSDGQHRAANYQTQELDPAKRCDACTRIGKGL